MNKKNTCNRFMRGNIQITSNSLKSIKLKACCGCSLFLLVVFFSIYWINWDAAIVFYPPSLSDIQPGFTKEVDLNKLHTKRWYEKRAYVEDIFKHSCETYDYTLLTNLNIRILGSRISDSMCYNCVNNKLYINLNIQPQMSQKRLICNETYGNKWTIRKDRFHPLQYSYIDKTTLNRETHTPINYEETCLFYQANDLLKGTWTI